MSAMDSMSVTAIGAATIEHRSQNARSELGKRACSIRALPAKDPIPLSIEDHGLVGVTQNPVLQMPTYGAR